MSHETPSSNPDNAWQNASLIFKKISEVEQKDIENFRQQIKHNDYDIFDKLTPDKQEVMVAIYNMSDEELATMVEQGTKYQLGVHDIDTYLLTIYELTEDPRFEKFLN